MKEKVVRRLGAVVVNIVAGCCVVASTLAGEAEYTPTMKDMMSIEDTLHRYHEGLDKHDNTLWASAFAEDGTMVMVDHARIMTLTRDQIAKNGLMGNAPDGAGGPPGGGAIPADIGEIWHFSETNSHFKFESPTRATHYSYWMEVHVQEGSKTPSLAIPGHYDDVLVKRKGQWLLLTRKVVIGEK
jgi:hypothetical protein